MRPGYRRRRPRWRRGLDAAQRTAQRAALPPDAVVLVLALCGAIAMTIVALYVLGV